MASSTTKKRCREMSRLTPRPAVAKVKTPEATSPFLINAVLTGGALIGLVAWLTA